jgi:hypothetical protein
LISVNVSLKKKGKERIPLRIKGIEKYLILLITGMSYCVGALKALKVKVFM